MSDSCGICRKLSTIIKVSTCIHTDPEVCINSWIVKFHDCNLCKNFIDYNQILSKSFVRKYNNCINWEAIAKNCILSSDNIRELKKFINWKEMCRYQKLSEKFIKEFQDFVDWESVCRYQTLSEDFIRDFQDMVDWTNVYIYQEISDEFKTEYKRKFITSVLNSLLFLIPTLYFSLTESEMLSLRETHSNYVEEFKNNGCDGFDIQKIDKLYQLYMSYYKK